MNRRIKALKKASEGRAVVRPSLTLSLPHLFRTPDFLAVNAQSASGGQQTDAHTSTPGPSLARGGGLAGSRSQVSHP